MLVTLAGIFTEVNPLQLKKALFPIVSNPSGRDIEVRVDISLKASLPISVTPSPTNTSVNLAPA